MSFMDEEFIPRMLHLADVLLFPSTVQQQCMEHEVFTWEASAGLPGHVLFTLEECAVMDVIRQTTRVTAIAIW